MTPMPNFRYRALTKSGEIVSGEISAPSVGDVAHRIEYLGLVPIDTITEQEGAAAERFGMLNLSSAGGGVKRGVVPAVCTSAVREALGRRRIHQGTPAVAGRGSDTGHIRELQPGTQILPILSWLPVCSGFLLPGLL